MRRIPIALVIAAIALSSCDSPEPRPEQTGGKVASLTSAAPKASAKPERPRERLDGTPEEYEALLGPYNKCLKEHGALPKSEWYQNGQVPEKSKLIELADKATEADRICGPLYSPLPPWEKDPANPESRDFARDVVKCLKGKGIKYVEVGDNGVDVELGGANNDMPSIRNGLDLIPACEREVAAKLKK
ncbi:hypothetical protein BJ973_004552 [Actinoplanes tereljensis]|uniref:Lipoprotein n=1 Tax=Paractinoplanes tereljensis TaxID=571912 RepID=A0A919NU10_9ACTN|nr:hypothetical protein [Actinoplanes tereljensis]GIF23939.1 hypothetical protein Ate02nite_66690 [Actinoplanes tereljensis]